MKNNTKIIFGVILVIFGSLLLIDRTGLLHRFSIDIWSTIWTFWPLILVGIGIKLFLEKKNTGAIILTTLGTVLFLTNIFDWNFFAVLWPLIIISIGISIIFKEETPRINTTEKLHDNSKIDDTVVFWGGDTKVTSTDFKGGEVNAIFGGYKLDLREAKISKDGAQLDVNAIFGGVEVLVPKNCRVVTNGTGIFGGWNPELKPNDTKSPVLEIMGSAIFGGVDIKE